ncbi:unnamed protein product [Trichobilharzia regenti]|nr:unnamed protein product [Trichobilharzia regenti]
MLTDSQPRQEENLNTLENTVEDILEKVNNITEFGEFHKNTEKLTQTAQKSPLSTSSSSRPALKCIDTSLTSMEVSTDVKTQYTPTKGGLFRYIDDDNRRDSINNNDDDGDDEGDKHYHTKGRRENCTDGEEGTIENELRYMMKSQRCQMKKNPHGRDSISYTLSNRGDNNSIRKKNRNGETHVNLNIQQEQQWRFVPNKLLPSTFISLASHHYLLTA